MPLVKVALASLLISRLVGDSQAESSWKQEAHLRKLPLALTTLANNLVPNQVRLHNSQPANLLPSRLKSPAKYLNNATSHIDKL